MNLLVLEPYYAGSHRAFVDGWRAHSRHDWTLLTLPGYKWKWRMRHAAFTFAEEITRRYHDGHRWDALVATDMIDLAELLGLTRSILPSIPVVAYFHENQLTYPTLHHGERDYHFALTNFATAAAADRVWFNSDFHRCEFFAELGRFFRRMPDYPPLAHLEQLAEKSSVYPQGVYPIPPRPDRTPGPLRILWAGRWEYDKNPEDFFAAVGHLRDSGVDFRLSVIGEQFEHTPPVFAAARETFADRIDRWGYLESRADYERCLAESDLIVSTAIHEFFGVTIVEAAAAGAFPVVPNRLAYPELFPPDTYGDFFYDGSVQSLNKKLMTLLDRFTRTGSVWAPESPSALPAAQRFMWSSLAPALDNAVAALLP